jgi:hypothetical protein
LSVFKCKFLPLLPWNKLSLGRIYWMLLAAYNIAHKYNKNPKRFHGRYAANFSSHENLYTLESGKQALLPSLQCMHDLGRDRGCYKGVTTQPEAAPVRVHGAISRSDERISRLSISYTYVMPNYILAWNTARDVFQFLLVLFKSLLT